MLVDLSALLASLTTLLRVDVVFPLFLFLGFRSEPLSSLGSGSLSESSNAAAQCFFACSSGPASSATLTHSSPESLSEFPYFS